MKGAIKPQLRLSRSSERVNFQEQREDDDPVGGTGGQLHDPDPLQLLHLRHHRRKEIEVGQELGQPGSRAWRQLTRPGDWRF